MVFGHSVLTNYQQLSGKIVGYFAFEVKKQKGMLVPGGVTVSWCFSSHTYYVVYEPNTEKQHCLA